MGLTGTGRFVSAASRSRLDRFPALTRSSSYLLLGSAVIFLGTNWPVMVLALRAMPPVWMAAIRLSLGAVVVMVISAITGNIVVPPRRDVPLILATALVRVATVMVLVLIALRLIPAGRASVLVWSSALWTVPIAAVFLEDRMTLQRWLGLSSGVAGVFVISELWNNNWNDRDVVVGTALLLLGAICNASTSVYVRRHRWSIDPIHALPWQLVVAATPVVALAFGLDGKPDIDWTWGLTANFAYQSTLVTGVAFWAQMVVLRRLPTVAVNLTMMGVPVIGVISSAIVLGEPLTLPLGIGVALVLTGVAINLVRVSRESVPVVLSGDSGAPSSGVEQHLERP